MKNVAVCRILLPWQWHGRCLSLAPSHSPAAPHVSEPWRPLGAEPACKARNMLGKGHYVAASVSTDTISFLLCLHLLDD